MATSKEKNMEEAMAKYEKFPQEVCERLGHYVYKLIDPRNGQVFYIGTGQNNRVFDHARAAENFVRKAAKANADGGEEDKASLKIKIIKEIHDANLEVISVIHRHGMDAETAFEVEAALIDATPYHAGIRGHGSDRGPMNAQQIIDLYAAKEADFRDDQCIIIKIRQTTIDEHDGNVYEAVRLAWPVNPDRANQAQYIIAACNGLIVGVFVMDENGWQPIDEKYGFTGAKAPQKIWNRYVGKRLPADYMQRGAQIPFRYVNM